MAQTVVQKAQTAIRSMVSVAHRSNVIYNKDQRGGNTYEYCAVR